VWAGAACRKHEFLGILDVFAYRRSQMVFSMGFLWLRSAGEIPEMDAARYLCGSCVLTAALALLLEVYLKHKNEKMRKNEKWTEICVVTWGRLHILCITRPGGMGLVPSCHRRLESDGGICQMVHKCFEIKDTFYTLIRFVIHSLWAWLCRGQTQSPVGVI